MLVSNLGPEVTDEDIQVRITGDVHRDALLSTFCAVIVCFHAFLLDILAGPLIHVIRAGTFHGARRAHQAG